MVYLCLMIINIVLIFIRGGMIYKFIWYLLIFIGNVCYVNMYNISFFKKYFLNDYVE